MKSQRERDNELHMMVKRIASKIFNHYDCDHFSHVLLVEYTHPDGHIITTAGWQVFKRVQGRRTGTFKDVMLSISHDGDGIIYALKTTPLGEPLNWEAKYAWDHFPVDEIAEAFAQLSTATFLENDQ